MTLESATYIDSLNQSYPEGSAKKSKGDDHLRLIKSVLKNTFPNITGAMTATHTSLNRVETPGSVNHPLESGTKTIFYQASPPTGWTQDTTAAINGAALRGVTGSGGGSGGSNDISGISTQGHALTVSEIPSHDHSQGSTGGNNASDVQSLTGNNLGSGSVTALRAEEAFGSSYWTSSFNRDNSNHSHSNPNTDSTGGDGAHSHNIDPKTIDVIVATKD